MGQVNVSYFQVKTANLYLDMYLLFFITKERIIYFVIVNEFNTHFNCYETEKSGYLEIFDLDKIYDYHSLGVYYVAPKMSVPLHHHLRFS